MLKVPSWLRAQLGQDRREGSLPALCTELKCCFSNFVKYIYIFF